MKFKNYIETESGIKDTSTSPGTAGQVLSSTVTGTSWIDPDTLVSAASKLVVIACKNVSGTPILKGTPVYQSGTVGATDVIEVEPADATISTGYLPAIGILQTTLNNNGFGNVVITGEFLNYSTADIPSNNPGGVPTTGDTVYLAAGGGLTCIRPTGAGNAIQNLGLVGKVSGGNAGSITVASIMRANDVPNLPTGRIWIGDGNTIVSDTVYVDEPNNRVGIGTTNPRSKLHVEGVTGSVPGIGAAASAAQIGGSTYGTLFSTLTSGTGVIQQGRSDGVALTFPLLINPNGGNVGIGTTSPNAKLEVVGTTGVIVDSGTSSRALLTLKADGSSFGGGGQINIVGGSSDYANYSLNLYNSPNTLDATNQYQQGFGSAWSWDGNIRGFSGQPYTSYDFKSQGSSQMVIYNNNVGIGTTTPLARLQVNSLALGSATNNTTTQAIFGASMIGNLSTLHIQDYRTATGTDWTSSGKRIQEQIDSSWMGYMQYNGTGNGGGLSFGTGINTNQSLVAERMRIDGQGNVGIGTTSPNDKLVVQGDGDGILVRSNDFTLSRIIPRGQTSTNWDKALFSLYNAAAENVRIDTAGSSWFNGGNVGIGTTSPSQKLHVVGAGYFQNGSLSIGTTSNVLFNYISSFIMVAGSGQIISLGGGPGNINNNVYIGNGDLFVPNGDVGIGTTNPSSKLQVNGGVQLANDTASPSALKVGTFRYRTSGNNSYVDMCMQVGTSSYAWVNIVTNNW